MSTDLRTLLGDAADDLIPEHDPLEDRLDGVRRLVRRRRAVRRAQAGAGTVLGVAAIGSVAMLVMPRAAIVPAAPPSDLCGRAVPELADGVSLEVSGVGELAVAEGGAVMLSTDLTNDGDVGFTTATSGVDAVVSLAGTGQVVGVGLADPSGEATLDAGDTHAVTTTVELVSCGRDGLGEAGGPLADGSYVLSMYSDAVTVTGDAASWSAADLWIEVSDGVVSVIDDEPVTEPTAFAPACGEMIPAVPENPIWTSIGSAAGGGPFQPADPDEPYAGGMTLDLRVGTTALEPISGELSPEIVVVLTDLGGAVATWWRASDHGRPLDLGSDLDLAAQGSQDFPGFGWFPVTDDCAGTTIADGQYRLFAWIEVTPSTGTSDAIVRYPVLSAPLDVTVTAGEITVP